MKAKKEPSPELLRRLREIEKNTFFFSYMSDRNADKVSEYAKSGLIPFDDVVKIIDFLYGIIQSHNSTMPGGWTPQDLLELKGIQQRKDRRKGTDTTNAKRGEKAKKRQSLIKTFLQSNPIPEKEEKAMSIEHFIIKRLGLDVGPKTIKADLKEINLETR